MKVFVLVYRSGGIQDDILDVYLDEDLAKETRDKLIQNSGENGYELISKEAVKKT